MRVYVTSPSGDRAIANDLALRLESTIVGHHVVSRWHQPGVVEDRRAACVERGFDEYQAREREAEINYEDLAHAQVLFVEAQSPYDQHVRFESFVEIGMAIGMQKKVVILGQRPANYCYLETNYCFDDQDLAIESLAPIHLRKKRSP